MLQHFKFIFITICCSVFLASCSKSGGTENEGVIARVGEDVLTLNDVQRELSFANTKEDSTQILRILAEKWVEQQLLFKKASLNISDRGGVLEKKIQVYKEELYIQRYEQLFLNQNIDSIVSKQAIQDFYENKSSEFILSEPAVKPLFIVFPKELDLSKVRQWFYSKKAEDIDKLKDFTYQFSPKFYFEDTWMELSALQQEIPIKNINANNLFSSNGLILQDTVNYYYIKITEFVSKGEIAPKDLVKDHIVKILLHKRKLDVIKTMRNKIYREALHKEEFEIYLDK